MLEAPEAKRLCCHWWRSQQQTRAAVFVAIQEMLENPSQEYFNDDYCMKGSAVYQRVSDSYYEAGRSVYAATTEALEAAGH